HRRAPIQARGACERSFDLAPVSILSGWGFSFPRPLVQYPRPLADGHADPRSMLCPTIENAFGLIQATAREQQLSHPLAVSAPLLDLVEIAMVGDQGLVRFFVGPVGHLTAAIFISTALAAWRYRLQFSG